MGRLNLKNMEAFDPFLCLYFLGYQPYSHWGIHLGYNYKIGMVQENDRGQTIDQAHELTFSRIAQTPLAVSVRHEKSDATIFSGPQGPAKEAAYSASFVGVGGAF